MRRAVIGAVVTLLAIDSASACHRYQRWYYPWKQSCRATALAPKSAFRLSRARIDVRIIAEPRNRESGIRELGRPDFPIPNLADIDWGHSPDDETRGRILLRVILQGKDDR